MVPAGSFIISTGEREGKGRKQERKEVVGKQARELKKKKSYWTRWARVTSIASQAGPQISRARSGAAWEPTAGAPCAMPPGD